MDQRIFHFIYNEIKLNKIEQNLMNVWMIKGVLTFDGIQIFDVY